MKLLSVSVAILFSLTAPAAFAHCDWINGPVVADARTALMKGDVTLALKWVAADDEAEIRRAFDRTSVVRRSSAEATKVGRARYDDFRRTCHVPRSGETP